MRWVDKHQRLCKVGRENRTSVAYKVKVEHVKFILETVKENKFITIYELLALLLLKFKDLTLGKSHLHRILFDNLITRDCGI